MADTTRETRTGVAWLALWHDEDGAGPLGLWSDREQAIGAARDEVAARANEETAREAERQLRDDLTGDGEAADYTDQLSGLTVTIHAMGLDGLR